MSESPSQMFNVACMRVFLRFSTHREILGSSSKGNLLKMCTKGSNFRAMKEGLSEVRLTEG